MNPGRPGRPGRIAFEDSGDPAPGASAEDSGDDHKPAAAVQTEPYASRIALEVEPDPLAERNGHFSRIAGALQTMATEQATLRARCLHDASEALGAAAASLLPAMARAGFPALVADAAKSIAACGQWPELAVSLAPDDAEAIADFLAAGRPALGAESATITALRIDPRDDLQAGEASLRWDGGGARIDVAAITEAVLAEYRRKLDLIAQSGT